MAIEKTGEIVIDSLLENIMNNNISPKDKQVQSRMFCANGRSELVESRNVTAPRDNMYKKNINVIIE